MKRGIVFVIPGLLIACGVAAYYWPPFVWVFIVLAPLLLIASWDLIQARACNKNICPTGITTHDPWRVHGLSVADKAPRVTRYHLETVRHFKLMLGACGLGNPEDLQPEMLWRRITHLQTVNYRQLYRYLEPRELLDGAPEGDWREWWQQAREDSFTPAT